MSHATNGMSRTLKSIAFASRKRVATCLLFLLGVVFTIVVYTSASARLPREDLMEQRLAEIQVHLEFLESMYRARHEEVMALQTKVHSGRGKSNSQHLSAQMDGTGTITLRPEITALLKNISGTRAAAGMQPKNSPAMRTSFVFQLLPHLMNDPSSLRPAYHMNTGRVFADVVIGIPTVKRDKESYLMITLTHLVNGLRKGIDTNSTLIVIMIGETDLEYVINTARQIEIKFPKQVASGLIEVISPSASYYPDLDKIKPTLGDSPKRMKWRTKQNLDAIYLMAYAQSKGTFYLMLEDDVITKKNYMQEIMHFTADKSVSNPHWIFIEYCHIGGIGKLFRSSDLIHFITYLQLFYSNMPIDWLLESYLAERVCNNIKNSDDCKKNKLQVRPRHKTSLFQHIGLYSSLKGKIQKVKDSHFTGSMPTYHPHKNPPLETLRTDIEEHSEYTLKKAYDGQAYFWGVKPKKGDLVEFWFEKPTPIVRYTFRSGNVEHVSDKFYNTVVEILPLNASNFTTVGSFDEFGLAEGEIKKDVGPLSAVRLRVNKDSGYWVILSEIELKLHDQDSR